MGLGGGKGGSAKQQVTDYYMSILYECCIGPVDAFTHLTINEKDMEIPVLQNDGTVSFKAYDIVNQKKAFGGSKEGGGAYGRIYALFGNPTQRVPFALARRLLGTLFTNQTEDQARNQVPGFRGKAQLFFTAIEKVDTPLLSGGGGNPGNLSERAGFLWGTNYPQLPAAWIGVRRAPKGLSGDPSIPLTFTYEKETGKTKNDEPVKVTVTRTVQNANPAHVIFECLTSAEGLGFPVALVDVDSFLQAAQTLRQESFGISTLWERQTTVEDFVSEVLDHIDGTLATNPFSGKLYLKLLRGDYDESTLLVLNPDNCSAKDFQRTMWGEITNTYSVTWTNPVNEQTETVTAWDDSAAAIQQSEVLASKNFNMIRDVKLAGRVALREARKASRSLVACTVEVDRRARTLIPGAVVRLNWPEEGIENLVMRVGPVDYGKAGDPSIKISLLEDIFGLEYAEYTDQATKWLEPGSDPVSLDHLVATASPYYMVANTLGDEAAEQMESPQTYTMILCAQDALDTRVTDYLTERPDITGVLRYYPDGSSNNQSRAKLGSALTVEVRTDLFPLATVLGTLPEGGSLVMIVDESNPDKMEITAVESATESSIVVRRGVLDTVPQVWPADASVWLVDPNSRLFDRRPHLIGETVKYKFLPKTSRGQLEALDAPVVPVVLGSRQYRPYRPANVKVNNAPWGPLGVEFNATIQVTWSRRNRLNETALALAWDAGDTQPEDGQTSFVRLYDGNNNLIASWENLTGTSQNINLTTYYDALRAGQAGPIYTATLRVGSSRNGLESFQTVAYKLLVSEVTGGWGNAWDYRWGTT